MARRKIAQNIFTLHWPRLIASTAPKIAVAIVVLSLAPQTIWAQSREPLGKLIDLVQRKGDRRQLYNVICEAFRVPLLRNGECAVRQYALQEDPEEPHPGRIHAFDVISPQQVLLIVHDERVGTLFLVGPNGMPMNVASEIIHSGKPPSLKPLARPQWDQMTPKLNEEIAYWQAQESTIAKDKDVP